jgi:hypothetical protein
MDEVYRIIGTLTRTQAKRWAIQDRSGQLFELSCGEIIQVLIENQWFTTRLEHNGTDYYAVTAGIRLYSGMRTRQ